MGRNCDRQGRRRGNRHGMARRELMTIGLASLATACVPPSEIGSPYSSGTARPLLRVPRLACDSHIHILDPRVPATAGWKGEPVGNASVAAYRRFQARIGTERCQQFRYRIHHRACRETPITARLSVQPRGMGQIQS